VFGAVTGFTNCGAVSFGATLVGAGRPAPWMTTGGGATAGGVGTAALAAVALPNVTIPATRAAAPNPAAGHDRQPAFRRIDVRMVVDSECSAMSFRLSLLKEQIQGFGLPMGNLGAPHYYGCRPPRQR
jgi:hypothetical protein